MINNLVENSSSGYEGKKVNIKTYLKNEDEKRIFNNNFVSENNTNFTKISSINKHDLGNLNFY
jgi:hypothetical protein